MMAASNSPEVTVGEIIEVLSLETTGDQGKVDAYTKFNRQFQEAEVSLFSVDVTQNMSALSRVLMRDAISRSPDVCQGALSSLCVCLHDADIVRSLSITDGQDILKTLCTCILKSDQKICCTRALWCLGKQYLPSDVITKQFPDLIKSLEYALERWGGQSVTVEHEVVNTIARLAEQVPKEMGEMSARWGKLLLPLICHTAVKVRERVFVVMETNVNLLKQQQKDLVAAVMPLLKSKVLPEMKKMFANKQEIFILKSWSVMVDIFGEELHHGSSINHILQVAELGFKSASSDVKMAAFRAWQQLIDNFALNSSILSDPKRVKLIMQVFKLNNAKLEEVALVKMRVWWHFIWLLGNKISANFDMVAVPFLLFCLGGSKAIDNNKGNTPRMLAAGASPVTPHMNLTSASSQWPQFESLQLHGCDALALFLGAPNSKGDHDFKLDTLRCDAVTGPSFFIKHSTTFITLATEFFIKLGKDVPEGLMLHIWQWLIAHLENAIESPVKLDVRDTLHTLLLQFQVLVLSRVVNSTMCLKMFEGLCRLPRRLLCSSAYSIPGQEMVNSTPALFLTSLLLTPVLLQSSGASTAYQELFVSLLSCDLGSGKLDFLQAVVELLTVNLPTHDQSEQQEAALRLWNMVVHQLHEHVTKTNEVNQGDALEPKFTCCIQTLHLVVGRVEHLSQHSLKILQKTWMDLYKTVNRLAAMVTNAEANIICEELCQKISDHVKIDQAEVVDVDWLVHICHVIVTNLDYSSLGNQSMFGLGSGSPRKVSKKKYRSLENIHALIHLLRSLQLRAVQLARDTTKKPAQTGHQGMMNTLVESFSTIFTHVSSSHLIHSLIGQLAQPIAAMFTESSQKSSVKVYNNAFQQKLEKLWQDITTALQSRYTSLYDSGFLLELSPLLEATLLHSRRQIKNQALSFWTSTFANAGSLDYPESLKPVFSKIREKSHIQLPGWVAMATTVVQETPVSQMTQMDQSQMPEARIPGMPSPHKIHGSLLNKAVSPNVKVSPMRSPMSPKVNSASAKKKALNFFDDDKDFVVIAPPAKKKMVLTAHQREVMKERKNLPAMYNNLELSQDISLMASHFTTDTQMDSLHDETPTPTSQPFSLFGSVIPPTADSASQKQSRLKDTDVEKPFGDPSVADREDPAAKVTKDVTSPSLLDESSQTLRRSVRFKESSNSTCNTDTKETDSSKKPTRRRGKVTDQSEDCSKNETKTGKSKRNTCNNSDSLSLQEDTSVIVIDDSEGLDVDTQPPQLLIPVTSETDVVVIKDSDPPKQSASASNDADSTAEEMEVEFDSVPQNVLGITGLTPLSSSRSTESKSDGSTEPSAESSDKSSTDKKVSDSGKAAEIVTEFDLGKRDAMETASEPLLSWTHKLNELNQSPKVLSPLRKSLSQDVPKAMSPTKSPRRTRKKLTNENEEKGALDKWVIRSPAKKVDLSSRMIEEVIVANVLSGSFVEETQSPTKFDKIEKIFKSNLPSVMETPPKNVLETITASHGNSNRKLFGSQSSGGEEVVDLVEDSNIVPGSPDSKSFPIRSGTPILKIRKLTEEEVRMYSPSKKAGNKPDVEINLQNTLCSNIEAKITVSKKSSHEQDKKSSHEHDDFSEFKPLENTDLLAKGLSDTDQLCKEFTDTDQALLDIADNTEEVKKDADCNASGGGKEQSSPNLFSQEVTDEKVSQESKGDKYHVSSQDTLKSSSNSEQLFSEVADCLEMSETLSQSQQSDAGETFDIVVKDTLVEETVTPRRDRKRKQITPKKYSPEEFLTPKRKKLDDSEKGSAKKAKLRSNSKNKHKTENDKVERTSARKRNLKQKVETLTSDGSQDEFTEDNSQSSIVSSGECVIVEEEKIILKAVRKSLTLKKDDGQVKKRVIKRRDDKASDTEEKVDAEGKHDGEEGKTDKGDENIDKGDQEMSERKSDGTEVNDAKTTEDHSTEPSEVEMTSEGEKTPDSGNISSKSERRSTTRHKKEVVQKISLQRDRDVVVNDDDSNIPETKEINVVNKTCKSAENLEKIEEQLEKDVKRKDKGKKQTEESCKDVASDDVNDVINKADIIDDKGDIPSNEGEKDNVNLTEVDEAACTTAASKSESSDDDVPLIALQAGKNAVKRKTRQSVGGNNADVMQKGEKKVNTRLRSGLKTKTSPQAKKSVNLAIRRCRKMSLKTADSTEENKDTSEHVNKDTNKTVEKKSETEVKCNKEPVSDEDLVKNSDKDDDKDKEKTLDKFKENVLKSLNLAGQDELDETPRKGYEGLKSRAALLFRNSDSKLILGQRKFERRKGFARRSILKPVSAGALTDSADSPKRMDFHPITISRIYSPTASPSASILKKRRLSHDPEPQVTNSPPTKQRRVSFAEPLTDLENPLLETARTDSLRVPSPLTTTGRDPATCHQLSLTAVKLFDDSQSSVTSPATNTYQSTAQSQLNGQDPVFPELEGCSQTVQKILPQLTSSMWSRGLGQLVRARNINTIGDLARLTEVDIDNLPIRAPKVDTVRKVLEKFAETQRAKVRLPEKSQAGDIQSTGDAKRDKSVETIVLDEGANESVMSNPSDLEKAETNSNPMDCESSSEIQEDLTKKDEVFSVDIEKMLASSSNLIDEVNRLSQTVDQSDSQNKSCDKPSSQSSEQLPKERSTPKSAEEIVEELRSLAQICQTDGVKGLRTDQLFQAHQHLADIQSTIVNSLKMRCHSPTS